MLVSCSECYRFYDPEKEERDCPHNVKPSFSNVIIISEEEKWFPYKDENDWLLHHPPHHHRL